LDRLILFNKPYQVMSQFTGDPDRKTLADFIPIPDVYPAGRLDYDSEGLLLLTSAGWLQAAIADPRNKIPKSYLVQVEGIPDEAALTRLERGVLLDDRMTRPARAERIDPPVIWERVPPIRYRKSVPDSWLRLTLREGRNRQVRRMTAAAGYPTLRLIREQIGPWSLHGLQPGQWLETDCPRKNAF
jgi:23S rRNA pseudouridine2457 synthase